MKFIFLTQGQKSRVSNRDFSRLVKYNWFAVRYKTSSGKARFYAARKEKGVRIMMHRELLGFPACFVDHQNRDSLDNRRRNLRRATSAQNAQNSGNALKPGIRKRAFSAGYQVRISIAGKRVHVGEAHSWTDACRLRRAAVQKHHREFSATNQKI